MPREYKPYSPADPRNPCYQADTCTQSSQCAGHRHCTQVENETMSKPPGGGCDDPRKIHNHWCGYCGAQLAFSSDACQRLAIIPPCPRCDEKDWRNDIDELTAPDHKESA